MMLRRGVSVMPAEQRWMTAAPGAEAMHQLSWGALVLEAGCELGGHMRVKEGSGVFFQHRTCTVKLASKWAGARQASERVITG